MQLALRDHPYSPYHCLPIPYSRIFRYSVGLLMESMRAALSISPPDRLSPSPKTGAGDKRSGGEMELILDILTQTDWNIAKAARMLSMSRPTLYRKMREYGIGKQ